MTYTAPKQRGADDWPHRRRFALRELTPTERELLALHLLLRALPEQAPTLEPRIQAILATIDAEMRAREGLL